MISYLLFDLDGTLTNPKEGITRSVQYALRQFDIEEPDLDRLVPFIGPPLQQSFQQFYGFSPEQALQAVEHYRDYFRSGGIFENYVYPGIPALLSGLQAMGITMAVASSKPTVFVRQILDKFALSPYFTIIEGSNLDGSRVEKQEVIEEVLRQLGNPGKEQLLMIGDRSFDVLGARAMGFDCVGVAFGFAAPGELEQSGAVYIADTVEQLHSYLQDRITS